jgi:Chaperone of endosialidase
MLFDKVAAFQSRRSGAISASLAPMKPISRLIITILPFLCLLAAWPKAQAVVPPPDGGYPNLTTAEGQKALFSLTTGAANTAVGWSALLTNAAGSFNTATGAGALLFNTADDNTAFGAAALLFNTAGVENTAVGASALLNNTSGPVDTPNGGPASANTAVGVSALSSNTTGSVNTAIGIRALLNSATGNGNIALGAFAGQFVTDASDVIAIGADGENVSGTCYIGNIFGVTSSMGSGVFINSLGKLGTMTSSRRFKDDIKPMDQASEALFGLKPITFRYKKEIDPARTSQFGLVAEEVEKVNPALVVRDKEGKPNSVRYDQVNAMLLNEFLKEHRKVEKLEATVAQQRRDFEATIAQLKKGMETLVAHSKEQDAKIQRVSDRMEISNSAQVTVSNR